jgi:hypothetical protein
MTETSEAVRPARITMPEENSFRSIVALALGTGFPGVGDQIVRIMAGQEFSATGIVCGLLAAIDATGTTYDPNMMLKGLTCLVEMLTKEDEAQELRHDCIRGLTAVLY